MWFPSMTQNEGITLCVSVGRDHFGMKWGYVLGKKVLPSVSLMAVWDHTPLVANFCYWLGSWTLASLSLCWVYCKCMKPVPPLCPHLYKVLFIKGFFLTWEWRLSTFFMLPLSLFYVHFPTMGDAARAYIEYHNSGVDKRTFQVKLVRQAYEGLNPNLVEAVSKIPEGESLFCKFLNPSLSA